MQYGTSNTRHLLLSIILFFTLLNSHAFAVDIGSLAYILNNPDADEATVTGRAGPMKLIGTLAT